MKNVPRWGEVGTKLISPLEREFCPRWEVENIVRRYEEKYPAPTHYVHHVYICPPRNYIQEFWDRFLSISALVWECEPPPPAAHPPKTALT